jgi:hypothetical protein
VSDAVNAYASGIIVSPADSSFEIIADVTFTFGNPYAHGQNYSA